MWFLVDPPSACIGDVSRRLCVVVKLEVLGAVETLVFVVAVVVVVVVAVVVAVVVVVVAAAVVGVVTVVVVVSKEEGPGGRVTTSAPHFTNNFPVAGDRENGRVSYFSSQAHTHARTHARTHTRMSAGSPIVRKHTGTMNVFIVQRCRNIVLLKKLRMLL